MVAMILPDNLNLGMVSMLRDRELEQIERIKKLLEVQNEQVKLLLDSENMSAECSDLWNQKLAAWDILINMEKAFCLRYFSKLQDYVERSILSDSWQRRENEKKGEFKSGEKS